MCVFVIYIFYGSYLISVFTVFFLKFLIICIGFINNYILIVPAVSVGGRVYVLVFRHYI